MPSRHTATVRPGAAPAPRLEFRGAGLPPLFELRRLLADAGLPEVRLTLRPGRERGVSVSVLRETPPEAALRCWQLWTLPTALKTDMPGLAVTMLTAGAMGREEALRAALDAAGTSTVAKLHRIGTPLARGADAPLGALAAAADAAAASEGGVVATLVALWRDPRAFDLLVARDRAAAATAAALGRLAGPGVLATELTVDGRRTSVRARPGATGLLLATIRALACAGVARVPRTLLDALLRALEDGVTHDGLAHLAPRVPLESDAAFLAAVGDRLGERPRWLANPLAAARPSNGDRPPAPAPVHVLRPVAAAGGA